MFSLNDFKACFRWLVICAVFSAGSLAMAADVVDKTPLLELQKVMQGLGENMQRITDGISNEDWDQVAEVALLIANHPQPSASEKVRILTFLGPDAPKFKGHDDQSTQAAQALHEVALAQDGEMVIASFGKLQNTCLACHQSFRKPLMGHFSAD